MLNIYGTTNQSPNRGFEMCLKWIADFKMIHLELEWFFQITELFDMLSNIFIKNSNKAFHSVLNVRFCSADIMRKYRAIKLNREIN